MRGKALIAREKQREQLEQGKAQLEGAYSDACDTLYAEIIEGSPDVLGGLIQAAVEANHFLRQYCKGDTPEEQYRGSVFIQSAVHTLMNERYPDRFQAINDDYQSRLDALDSQIAALG